MPLADFVRGNREDDACGPTSSWWRSASPSLAPNGRGGHFLKLGTRRYLVISIVMVASPCWRPTRLTAFARVQVAVGALLTGRARRLSALEEALLGRPCGAALGGRCDGTRTWHPSRRLTMREAPPPTASTPPAR